MCIRDRSHDDGEGNEGGGDVAQDHAGSGHFEGRGGAQKQAGADRAADRDHGHLSGGELMVEALFVDFGGGRHSARYQNLTQSPKFVAGGARPKNHHRRDTGFLGVRPAG